MMPSSFDIHQTLSSCLAPSPRRPILETPSPTAGSSLASSNSHRVLALLEHTPPAHEAEPGFTLQFSNSSKFRSPSYARPRSHDRILVGPESSVRPPGNSTLQFEETGSLRLMRAWPLATVGDQPGQWSWACEVDPPLASQQGQDEKLESRVSRCVCEWVFETWLLVVILDTTTTVKKHIVKVCIYIYAYTATDHLSASRSTVHAVDHTNNLGMDPSTPASFARTHTSTARIAFGGWRR